MTHDNQVLFPADSAVVIRFAKPRAAGGASSTAVPTVSRYCGLPPHRRASAIAIKRSQRSSSSSRPAGLEHAERAFVVRRRLIEGQTGERPIARPARVADRLGGVGHLRGGEPVVRQLVDLRAILDVAGELELVDRERVATAKELLRRIVGMLVGLGKWMENAAP
jgi:hypothetical protein